MGGKIGSWPRWCRGFGWRMGGRKLGVRDEECCESHSERRNEYTFWAHNWALYKQERQRDDSVLSISNPFERELSSLIESFDKLHRVIAPFVDLLTGPHAVAAAAHTEPRALPVGGGWNCLHWGRAPQSVSVELSSCAVLCVICCVVGVWDACP